MLLALSRPVITRKVKGPRKARRQRALGDFEHASRLSEVHAFQRHEKQSRTLIEWQSTHGIVDFAQDKVSLLSAKRHGLRDCVELDELGTATGAAVVIAKTVQENSEKPGAHRPVAAPMASTGKRAFQAVLDEIIGTFTVAKKRMRVPSQRRDTGTRFRPERSCGSAILWALPHARPL